MAWLNFSRAARQLEILVLLGTKQPSSVLPFGRGWREGSPLGSTWRPLADTSMGLWALGSGYSEMLGDMPMVNPRDPMYGACPGLWSRLPSPAPWLFPSLCLSVALVCQKVSVITHVECMYVCLCAYYIYIMQSAFRAVIRH